MTRYVVYLDDTQPLVAYHSRATAESYISMMHVVTGRSLDRYTIRQEG